MTDTPLVQLDEVRIMDLYNDAVLHALANPMDLGVAETEYGLVVAGFFRFPLDDRWYAWICTRDCPEGKWVEVRVEMHDYDHPDNRRRFITLPYPGGRVVYLDDKPVDE